MRSLLFVLLLTSCARPRLSIVATPSNEYIDLRPGHPLRPSNPTPPGATITIETGSDFLGYEQAFYDVAPGLRISFSSAETIIDGISRPQPAPRVPLFPFLAEEPSRCVCCISFARVQPTTTWRF
ncbi:MAG: hypothetical protein NTV52_21815 [Acidobacteria bacterium]|nr:hypothetical protein [Acidobacteriota bacterium]